MVLAKPQKHIPAELLGKGDQLGGVLLSRGTCQIVFGDVALLATRIEVFRIVLPSFAENQRQGSDCPVMLEGVCSAL